MGYVVFGLIWFVVGPLLKVFLALDRSKVAYRVRAVFQGFFPTTLLEFAAASVPIMVHDG